jgi:hypothetical protein
MSAMISAGLKYTYFSPTSYFDFTQDFAQGKTILELRILC